MFSHFLCRKGWIRTLNSWAVVTLCFAFTAMPLAAAEELQSPGGSVIDGLKRLWQGLLDWILGPTHFGPYVDPTGIPAPNQPASGSLGQPN